MTELSASLPEPFASALRAGRAEAVCDTDAPTPAAHLARARARIAAGRFAAAREDLDVAEPQMGDAARIERAYLDIREQGALRRGLKTAREVVGAAAPGTGLRARALHVLGQAQLRMRDLGKAVDALREAAALYETLDDDLGRAHVLDTLGTAYATHGRLEEALHHYALALTDKALLGDRRGLAVTMGNVGRLELRAGRYEGAIECFERDLALSLELGDLRGQARMHEDIGRAWAGLEDDARAEQEFRRCLDLAEAHGFPELAFFAHLDLAALRLRQGRVAEADAQVAAAEQSGHARETPYLGAILQVARGEICFAKGEASAVDVLQRGLRRLTRADVPDIEIPARIRLARAFMAAGLTSLAERTLLEGLDSARRGGITRYLPALNEAMTELEVVEPALEEAPRARHAGPIPDNAPADGAYVVLERLGEGAFGEVFRAYDPVRGREVALKVVHLERRYDLGARRRLQTSVKVEREAASRVRHPGVARTFAIGTEEDGGIYIVQEYVEGLSLRHVMEAETDPDLPTVAAVLARLANALEALHEVGVVHRDLKPENVIVRTDGTPVLVDFGIAHLEVPGVDLPSAAGTLEYMAPEQARGDAIDGRADLYALGVIAFEWLVGFRPVKLAGIPRDKAGERMHGEEAPRLREFRPDMDTRMDDLVAALLAKNADDRPADASSVATVLRALE